MKLSSSLESHGYFLLYAALLTLPALAVDIHAFSTFEPVKVMVTIGIATLIGWWRIMYSKSGKSENGSGIRHLRCLGSRNGIRAPWALWTLCLYGYWGSVLIATITSVAPWVSFFGMAPRYQGLAMYMALFIAMMCVMKLSRPALEKVLSIAMVGAVMVSIFGILQGIFPILTQWWEIDNFLGRAFSTMGHPSYLADYLLLITPLFYWKWIVSRRWWVWSLLGVTVGAALLLTLSRGAFIGLVGSVFFFVGIYGYWHARRGLLMSAIATPLLFVLLVVSVNVVPSGLIDSVPFLSRLVVNEENVRSISTRFALWPSVVTRIAQRPLFGYGPDTFALSFAKVAPNSLLQSENFHAYADRGHNFFLDSMMNVGVVGTGFLIVLLWLTMRVVIRSGDPLFLALGSALFGHIISQQFEFSLTVHLIFFWMYLGIILGRPIDTIGIRISHSARWIASLFAVSIFLGYLIPTFLADRLARSGNFAEAIRIAPHRNEYVLAEAGSQIEQEGNQETIEHLLHRAKQFAGDLDYRPYYYEGTLWSKKLEYPKSFASFEEAIARSPIFPPLRKAYGIALLESGDRAGALVQFNHYLDMAPRERTRVFYKLHPQFDEIFELISKASIAK